MGDCSRHNVTRLWHVSFPRTCHVPTSLKVSTFQLSKLEERLKTGHWHPGEGPGRSDSVIRTRCAEGSGERSGAIAKHCSPQAAVQHFLESVKKTSGNPAQEVAVQSFDHASWGCRASQVMHQCELSLLALGETGKCADLGHLGENWKFVDPLCRYADLSGVPGFCDVLLNQLESQQEAGGTLAKHAVRDSTDPV